MTGFQRSVEYVLIVFVAVSLALPATARAASAGPARHVVEIAPRHIRAGDTVRVFYRLSDPTAAFRSHVLPMLRVYVYGALPLDPDSLPRPVLIETPMLSYDTSWGATFVMNVPGACFYLLRFDSGVESDNNNGYFWMGLIYDAEGAPVENALAFRGWCEMGKSADSMYAMRPDINAAKQDFAKEIELHPRNFFAWGMRFQLRTLSHSGISPQSRVQIDSVMDSFAGAATEMTAPRIDRWYGAIGRSEKRISLEDKWIREKPNSDFAIFAEFRRARGVHDPFAQITAAEQVVAQAASDTGYAIHDVCEWLMTFYLENGKYEKAEQFLRAHPWLSPRDYDKLYRHVAQDSTLGAAQWRNALANVDSLIEREMRDSTMTRDMSLTPDQRNERENALLGECYYTAGLLSLRLNILDSAMRYLAEAVQRTRMSDPRILSAALHIIIEKGKQHQWMANPLMMFAMGSVGNDSLWNLVERAYPLFDEMPMPLDRIRQMFGQMNDIRRQGDFCRHQYRMFAPDFTLQTLDGRDIPLALLKGKVIVLDFWGTWCAPCRYTLPRVDSVYREYRDNDSVRFFAVDCDEQLPTANAVRKVVRAFLDSANISLPVLLDTAKTVAALYGIQYYPTRIVIDTQGVVRVMQVGYPGENVADELRFQLDMILHKKCSF